MASDPFPAPQLILASSSEMRRLLLERAGVGAACVSPRIDEVSLRASLVTEGTDPPAIADYLAEQKARKVAERHPQAVVIGSDQVLDLAGRVLGKPETREKAHAQLLALAGRSHRLCTAVVVYDCGRPVWRHMEIARMTTRAFSSAHADAYLVRNWPQAAQGAGCYRIEGEGVRLFSAIEGDHFAILGLPLVPLLSFLSLRSWIAA